MFLKPSFFQETYSISRVCSDRTSKRYGMIQGLWTTDVFLNDYSFAIKMLNHSRCCCCWQSKSSIGRNILEDILVTSNSSHTTPTRLVNLECRERVSRATAWYAWTAGDPKAQNDIFKDVVWHSCPTRLQESSAMHQCHIAKNIAIYHRPWENVYLLIWDMLCTQQRFG